MTTTDLKPGDIVQHPEWGPGLVGGGKQILYLARDGFVYAAFDPDGWERVETVRPGHVQVRVDDLDLSHWLNKQEGDNIWGEASRVAIRAAKAVAAQPSESTPPADEQDVRWSLPADMGDKLAATIKTKIDETFTDRDDANASGEATYECPWCSTIVTFSLSLNRNPRGGVMAWVAADGAHTCPPVQPDEPTLFGARIVVTDDLSGKAERWCRQHDEYWASENGALMTWAYLTQRGAVTLGWETLGWDE